MDTKLSNRLFKKFKFLRKKEMPDGFDHGDGWFQIVHDMCLELRDSNDIPDSFVITKVYDKYGDLAIHSRGGNNTTRTIIESAKDLAADICDECGNDKGLEMCPKCNVPVIEYPDVDENDEK